MTNKLKSHLYALQLLEYDPDKFLDWVLANPKFFPAEKKGKLGWSGKVKVLYYLSVLIQLIVPALLAVIVIIKNRNTYSYMASASVLFISYATLYSIPFIPLTISLFAIKPVEYLYRIYIIKKATRRLQQYKKIRVIGITGSYGKTSVKHILSQILSTKYKTVATPESYNKMLSIARVILSQVNSETEILIIEMGAYKRGEIAEICRMVKPQIGIITGITIQHLERFKTLENIKKAKYELISSLPKDGFAVFNMDNAGSKELYEKCGINKSGYTIDETQIESTSENTFFSLFGERVRTTLLGRHNVLNILAAVAVAKYLGLTNEEVAKRIPFLSPAPHRLELIRGENQSLIIDDAFSSNVEGYKAAFGLVKNYQNYPKVLVTPGLVELGKNQSEENFKMAVEAADTFDFAVVVNLVNRAPLLNGFLEKGWTLYNPTREENESRWTVAFRGVVKDKIVFVADDLNSATRNIFPKITRNASIILLENDLPDIYR